MPNRSVRAPTVNIDHRWSMQRVGLDGDARRPGSQTRTRSGTGRTRPTLRSDEPANIAHEGGAEPGCPLSASSKTMGG